MTLFIEIDGDQSNGSAPIAVETAITGRRYTVHGNLETALRTILRNAEDPGYICRLPPVPAQSGAAVHRGAA